MSDKPRESKGEGRGARRAIALFWLVISPRCLYMTTILLVAVAVIRFGEDARLLTPTGFLPGGRVLLDAHNCYPYHGLWSDRIERALKTGLPIAIEQDLVWYTDRNTGRSWSIVAHNQPFSGDEPTLKSYFFERIRPIVERALHDGNNKDWPLITLNLDFKTEEPAHLTAIWDLLGEYESWLCTAERTASTRPLRSLELRPVLVLTGGSDVQQKVFHDEVPVGKRLRLFGSLELTDAPLILVGPANNYRRWLNNPWSAVEKGGQQKAGEWTPADAESLQSLVKFAHDHGLWIRFYTLNGHDPGSSQGWSESYNFGSEEAARIRWKAAIDAGVDFVATDQYELFAKLKSKYGLTNGGLQGGQTHRTRPSH